MRAFLPLVSFCTNTMEARYLRRWNRASHARTNFCIFLAASSRVRLFFLVTWSSFFPIYILQKHCMTVAAAWRSRFRADFDSIWYCLCNAAAWALASKLFSSTEKNVEKFFLCFVFLARELKFHRFSRLLFMCEMVRLSTINFFFGGGLVKIFTRYKHGKVLTGEVAYRFWSRPCDFDLRFLLSLQFLHKVHVSRLPHSICSQYPRNPWTSKIIDVHWCPRRGYKPTLLLQQTNKTTNILLI